MITNTSKNLLKNLKIILFLGERELYVGLVFPFIILASGKFLSQSSYVRLSVKSRKGLERGKGVELNFVILFAL